MPYLSATADEREDMLHKLGIIDIKELFDELPERLRYPEIDLEDGKSELEVARELAALASANAPMDGFRWFLGAGVYDHFIPAAVGALAGRSEFTTAYTPYQPEVSQGTLQAMFEYQSLIAELAGLDLANAGHYDGATALAEAAIMALRGDPAKNRVLVPAGLHPEYRAVLETYLKPLSAVLESYDGPPAAALRTVAAVRSGAAGSGAAGSGAAGVAAVIASYPDFFGRIPDLTGAADASREAGALFIVQADPIMLGLFKSPGDWGADIMTAEGQALGNEPSFGGPYLGVMAARAELVRRLPGRIVGEARDAAGRRGFVLTLVAREQHIRREKAVSNICSNQALIALRAAIYLALLGKAGLRRTAELCWHNAHYVAGRIAALSGYAVAPGRFFKEFVVSTPLDAESLSAELRAKRIVPGLPLSRYFPERPNELLVCVTEKASRADMDDLISALGEVGR